MNFSLIPNARATIEKDAMKQAVHWQNRSSLRAYKRATSSLQVSYQRWELCRNIVQGRYFSLKISYFSENFMFFLIG